MKILLSLSFLLLMSFSVQADWQLNNEQSSVNFISIKKSAVGEVHGFKSLSGSLKKNNAVITIDLSSVDTKVPIRNERMKEMLFEVANFSSAVITTVIDQSTLVNLKEGDSYQKNVKILLSLHGTSKEISSVVQVVKLSNNKILVSSIYPVIIKAADFSLSDGIEALIKVAKLPVISSAVPVTFNLLFEK